MFTSSLAHDSPWSFVEDSIQAARSVQSLRIARYTGDMLELFFRCGSPGHLTFVDNWDPDWKAWINGEQVPISLAFGTFKSVAVTPGNHVVRFEYIPFSSEIERFKSGR
jgi:hypothetical protein